MKCPCVNCPKKGCGSYHDQCEEYQKFVKGREQENLDRYKNAVNSYSDHPKKRNAIRKRMKESIK